MHILKQVIIQVPRIAQKAFNKKAYFHWGPEKKMKGGERKTKEHRKQNMTDGGKPLVSPRGGYPKSGYIQAAQKIGPVILSLKTNETCTLSKILARQMRFD